MLLLSTLHKPLTDATLCAPGSDGDAVAVKITINIMPPISDDIIENELLFYVRIKIHSMPKDAIVDSCIKFYSVDEVSDAVMTLENSLQIRMSKCNKTDKSDPTVKILTDIYDKLWSLDAASAPIPQFVAFDLS